MSKHNKILEGLEGHKEKQSELAWLLEEASKVIEPLDWKKGETYFRALSQKVNSESFKLLVVGEFKNGKSTFINSFLGQEVLPAYAVPCTAVINEIKYGAEQKALLYFKDPLSEQAKDFIAKSDAKAEVKDHIRRHGSKEPIEIPVGEIESYATIPTDMSEKEMAQESPYEKIELFWPLELLENAVELIDSPGLNEAETRTEVTRLYLDRADAILFVISASKVGGQAETDFLNTYLKSRGFENIYFIINRWDQIRNETEKQRIVKLAKKILPKFTTFGEDGLYFVSALNALDGRLQNNAALYDGSGMPEFEKALSDFLVNDRGRVKLSQPSKELSRVLGREVLEKGIPELRGMLDSSLAEMKARRDEAMPKLERIKTKQKNTWENIDRQLEEVTPDIRLKIEKFYSDLNDKIRSWISYYEPSINISSQEDAESAMREISDCVGRNLETEQVEWRMNTLVPFIGDRIERITRTNKDRLEDFFHELNEIKGIVSGVRTQDEDVPIELKLHDVRVGFSDIDFSDIASMATLNDSGSGFKIGNFIVPGGIALAGLALLGPIAGIVGGILGYLFSSRSSGGNSGDEVLEQVKERLTEAILSQVGRTGAESWDRVIADLEQKLRNHFESILNGMDAEVQGLEDQVNRVIEEMEQGQQKIDHKKAILADCEEAVRRLKAKVDDYIAMNIDRR